MIILRNSRRNTESCATELPGDREETSQRKVLNKMRDSSLTLGRTSKVYDVLWLKSWAALVHENRRDEGSVPSSKSDGSYHNSSPVEGERRDLVPLICVQWRMGARWRRTHLQITRVPKRNRGRIHPLTCATTNQ